MLIPINSGQVVLIVEAWKVSGQQSTVSGRCWTVELCNCWRNAGKGKAVNCPGLLDFRQKNKDKRTKNKDKRAKTMCQCANLRAGSIEELSLTAYPLSLIIYHLLKTQNFISPSIFNYQLLRHSSIPKAFGTNLQILKLITVNFPLFIFKFSNFQINICLLNPNQRSSTKGR